MDTLAVPMQVSRETLIRLLLEATAHLTTTPPLLEVRFADFPLWLKHLGCRDVVTLRLRHDGRVSVSAAERFRGGGYLVVETTVDAVRDMELPPVESGSSAQLPVEQWWRLESFASPEAVA